MHLQKLCSDNENLVEKLLIPSICNLALNQEHFISLINPAPWQNCSRESGSIDSWSDPDTGWCQSSGEKIANEAIGGTRSGPPGANLFVYHLPKRFGDKDLFHLFSQSGKIVSAKVYIDKMTQESKCFGFVSFRHKYEAGLAIKTLNGIQVILHNTLGNTLGGLQFSS